MMKEITAKEVKQRLDAGEPLILIDVREPYEHDEFDIGGTNIPVTELPFRLDELKLLGNGDLVLYCQSGNRSILAQKLLAMQFGIEDSYNLKGGVNAWKEATA